MEETDLLDFENLKGGNFSKQFKVYQKQYPKSQIKTLEDFCKVITENPHHYQTKTVKRATSHQRKNAEVPKKETTDNVRLTIEPEEVPKPFKKITLTIPSI